MRNLFWNAIVLIVVLGMAVSCHFTDVQEGKAEAQDAPQYSLAVIALLEKTPVRLFDGVEESDIGLSFEGLVSKLTTDLSEKHGRSVQGYDTVAIKAEEMIEIIKSQLEKNSLPELFEPTAEDIASINQDFPSLTEEEIVDELVTIRRIYLDQVGTLVLKDFMSSDYEILPEGSERSVGYSDGAFYFNDEKLTVQEIAAMAKHLLSAVTLIKQKDLAQSYTKQYMGTQNNVNDKSDAFRHGIWNVVMAKEGVGLKDEKMAWARDFATAHEAGAKYIAVESEMDLHNNNVGLRYYNANSSKKYTKILFWKAETGVSEPSYTTACNVLKDRAINATLVNKNTLTVSEAKNRINNVPADTMVYIVVDTKSYW
jgi:hypothetical protein